MKLITGKRVSVGNVDIRLLSHKQRQNSFFCKKKNKKKHTINETTFVHSVYAFRLNSSFYEIIFCPQTTKFLSGKTDNLRYMNHKYPDGSSVKIVFPSGIAFNQTLKLNRHFF